MGVLKVKALYMKTVQTWSMDCIWLGMWVSIWERALFCKKTQDKILKTGSYLSNIDNRNRKIDVLGNWSEFTMTIEREIRTCKQKRKVFVGR